MTEALEDGRYAVACVRARVAGEPLPVRRPPCFFNPAHGPSTTDIEWAPPGGQPRQVPVCAADADRRRPGRRAGHPHRASRASAGCPTGRAGRRTRPGRSGYFGGYAASGLLPGFLLGSLLAPGWGGFDGDGFDSSYDDGGDSGDGGGDGGGTPAVTAAVTAG